MARRLALAILVTVWATLIVAGVGAYLAVRAMLLDDLDRQIRNAARRAPEVEAVGGKASGREARYFVLDDAGNRVSSSTVTPSSETGGEIVSRRFVTLQEGGGARRYRSITVRFDAAGG